MTQPYTHAVEVCGELPYYVPFPEKTALKPSLIGAEQFYIELEHFEPPRLQEQSHGVGVDDRRGTFIKSRVVVKFPLLELADDYDKDAFVKKALVLTNRLLSAIKYLARDPAIRHIARFDRMVIRAWKLRSDGYGEPGGHWYEVTDHGPFGLQQRGELAGDSLQSVWWLFNELERVYTPWILILDARYHHAIGDFAHAIIDLGTALDTHIATLIEIYRPAIPNGQALDTDHANIYYMHNELLLAVTGHSLHEWPDMFANLEYIREIRNSIVHRWKPEFRISENFRRRTRYLATHEPKDGQEISTSEQVQQLIDATTEIVKHVISLFAQQYGPR